MRIELRSERLVLRPWRDDDLEPFAVMNADPVVMEHYPKTATRAESDALAARIRAHFAEHDFGLWALERLEQPGFIGFVGLQRVPFEAHFTPAIEIGWRLTPPLWGRGYVTEAARLVLRHGFEALGLEEIVSMTVPANVRSWRVMERLGMKRDPADDFDNPRLPEGHHLRRHILYRLQRGGELA